MRLLYIVLISAPEINAAWKLHFYSFIDSVVEME